MPDSSKSNTFQWLDIGKSANQIPKPLSSFKRPAYRSGFNSFVVVSNFIAPLL
jgi:hypothetical protein